MNNSKEWHAARALDALDMHMFHLTYDSVKAEKDYLCESYIRHIGFRRYDTLKMVRQRMIDALGVGAFDKWGRISKEHIPSKFGKNGEIYDKHVIEHPDVSHNLTEERPNELFNEDFPEWLRFCFARKERHTLTLYGAIRSTLFCDVRSYQIYNKQRDNTWATASPFAFSKLIQSVDSRGFSGEGELIYIGDIFSGSNLSRFLFDYVTRIGHVIASELFDKSTLTFVMSGIPGDFHRIVIHAVARAYKLQLDQFYFPSAPLNIIDSKHIYWFSDSFEHNQHPAQLMDARSVEILSRVSAQLEIPDGSHPRVYVSQADAKQGRVANEEQVREFLVERGFFVATMSEMSIVAQISLIRGADVIVAQHGMELTMCAFHQKCLKLVELFSPSTGTDAFAALSKAMNFTYSYVVGEETLDSEDFIIPLGTLSDRL